MFMLTWSTFRVISLLSRLSRFQSFYFNGTERYSWVLFDPLSVHQIAILIWTTLWYWVTFLVITPPIISSPSGTESYSWVLLHPLSFHQNFIPIWTTLSYWETFLGITPPIISSSELYSDMNYPLVLSDILGYYSTHHLFIRTSFRYELRSELHFLLKRMSQYNSNGPYLNYLGATGVTKVIHLNHCWYTICIQQLDNISDTMSVITWCQPCRFIEG